jgi:hypothetical protein
MRFMIFKTVLVFNDGTELPITVAAREINEIPALVEKNNPLYNKNGQVVERFYVTDTFITLGLSQEQYEQEIMFCDIIGEDAAQERPEGNLVRSLM